MDMHTMPARPAARPVLVSLLLLGPVLTVTALEAAIAHGSLTVLSPTQYLVTALLFWSPLPFSLPAVLLGDDRDAALPHLRGLLGWPLRAVLLLPHLAFSPRSAVRGAATASLVGFAAAVALAVPSLALR